jgi:hypothetical protein
LTTVTSTAGALVRKFGGVTGVAASKVVSGAVLNNPLNTKSTVGLADQATRTKVTKSETRTVKIGVGDGATTVFTFPRRNAGTVTYKVAGSTVTGTLATDRSSVTLAAAPALNAVVQLVETITHANIDDAAARGPLATSYGTRTNH